LRLPCHWSRGRRRSRADLGIVFSFAVQHGADPKAIAKALSRDSNGRSFGPLAHALDLLDQQQNQWGP